MNSKRLRQRFLVPFLLLALFAGLRPLAAADWVVAADGKDTQAGTLEAPFASLRKASGVAAPGDVILVRGGTYAEGQVVSCRAPADKPIAVRACRGETPVIRNTLELPSEFVADGGVYAIDLDRPVAGVFQDTGKHPFVQTVFQVCPDRAKAAANAASFAWDKTDCKLYVNLENKADHPNDHRMTVSFLGTGLHIVNCRNVVVEGIDVRGSGGVGILVQNSENVSVRRCRAFDSARSGLLVDNCRGVRIEDCTVARAHNAVDLHAVTNLGFRHSTVAFSRAHGLLVGKGCGKLQVTDNVLFVGGVSGGSYYFPSALPVDSGFNRNIVRPNFLQRGEFSAYLEGGKTFSTLAEFQTATGFDRQSRNVVPVFRCTDEGREDFRLSPQSPGRDVGENGTCPGVPE